MNLRCLSVGGALMILASAGWAQPPGGEGSRALWDSQFLRQRPAAKPASTPAKQPETAQGALVGLTIWRLRPSNAADEPGARVFVHGEKGSKEWTPVRVAADAPLTEGQEFRFGIESARSGFLYVIEREEYADGTYSEPTLIFPTLKIRGGRNRVAAGIVIELPSWDDDPPYWWLKRSRPDHVGEVLTILVAPAPIEGIKIGPQPLTLNREQVAAWERRWATEVTRMDAKEAAAKKYTAAEKGASAGEHPLTQIDPVPEILFHTKAAADEAVLVNVPLRLRK